MRELSLFTGAGGGLLASHLLGWTTVCAVEVDPYCQKVLRARQEDGFLPPFPIFGDIREFDAEPFRGKVDIVSGGFPCQDISSAGRGAGIDGERSSLWKEFVRVLSVARPRWAFIENSPYLRTRGLVRVLKDLADLGFDAEWGCLRASEVGAPHHRSRMWIVAHANDERERVLPEHAEVARARAARTPGGEDASDSNCDSLRIESGWSTGQNSEGQALAGGNHWWPLALIEGVDDGLGHRMERVRATGNGQVPRVAALAFETLAGRFA